MGTQTRSSADQAIHNLMKWAQSPAWEGAFHAVLEEHTARFLELSGLTLESLQRELGPELSANLFGCVFEDLVTRRFEGQPSNLVDDYLKRRGWRETAPGRRYLQGLRDAVMSLYEIVRVEPGHWVEVRDRLRGGEAVRVSERSASQQLVRWDQVLARVIPNFDGHVFSGVVLPADSRHAEAVEQAFDAVRSTLAERGDTTEAGGGREAVLGEVLGSMAPMLTQLWLVDTLKKLGQPLPEMVNFDGEPIRFCEVHLPLRAGTEARAIAERLNALDGWEPQGDGRGWVWLAAGPGAAEDLGGREREGRLAPGTFTGGGAPTRGFLRLEAARLVLSTNSLERAERGKALLEGALAGLVDGGLIQVTSPEQALSAPAEPQEEASEIPPEVRAQVVQQLLDRHYRSWPDEPLPALEGLTPRQAAGDPDGRVRLMRLLKDMERNEARRSREGGETAYDFAWLWVELGLKPEP